MSPKTEISDVESWSNIMIHVLLDMQAVRGHLSVSLPPLSSPTLPLFICISPHTSVPSPGTTPSQ
jgi:hypothetical protein